MSGRGGRGGGRFGGKQSLLQDVINGTREDLGLSHAQMESLAHVRFLGNTLLRILSTMYLRRRMMVHYTRRLPYRARVVYLILMRV